MKLDHLFARDKAHKSKACAVPGCGRRAADHPSALEAKFDEDVEARGIGAVLGMVKEFEFGRSIGRKWRADRAWPRLRIMVELDGGSFMKQGGHSAFHDRGRDNYAALEGWIVLRFDSRYMRAGLAHRQLALALMIRMVGPKSRADITPALFPPKAELLRLCRKVRTLRPTKAKR